jgi:hypothetical protein
MIFVMSCGLVGKLAEKGIDKALNTQRVGQLWSDVPRMDGLNDSPTEDLPVAIKLVMHAFVNMVLNSDKAQKTPVSIDWIFFKYQGSETDINTFYTAEKMKSSGNWDLPEGMKSPCMDGKEKGLPGDVCLFQKTENGKQHGLIMIAQRTDEKDAPVLIYFLRAESEADPQNKTP